MAETVLYVKVEGGEAIEKALKDPQLVKGPIAEFLKKSALYVETSAKEKAPVDTGRLRASIASKIRETEAMIGSNIVYAPYVEFGSRPHFPPPSALAVWARRHGFPKGGEWMVARAIARRGGKKQPFLVPALQGAKSAIDGFLKEAINKIEAFWQSQGAR